MRKIILFIPLLSLTLLFPKAGIYHTTHFTSKGLDLFNVLESKNHQGTSIYRLKDTTYADNDVPYLTDLILSFNGRPSRLTRDDSGNYKIRYASYVRENKSGVHGGGAARFFRRDDRIEIESHENLWLTNCEDLGSFTIEFRMKPVSIAEGTVLFSRVGFLSGRRNGIEIVMKDRRISVRLFGIFRNRDGRRIDVFLNKGRALQENRWYHVSLSYDRISGRLAKYVNGAEEEVLYVSENEEPFINTYEPAFACQDKPVSVIGKDFYGILDEFRITHRHIEDLKKETEIAYNRYKMVGKTFRTPVNSEGVITSPVYKLDYTGTMVKRFSWNVQNPGNTFVWMEFRTSDSLFRRGDTALRWYRISNNQRNIFLKKTDSGDFLRGKYCQWRAHLIPSPDGKKTPTLSGIRMDYQLDPPPRPPAAVSVAGRGDSVVRLRWHKNTEDDILGYKIYYGLRAGKYDGVIEFRNGERITNTNTGTGSYIEFDVTNAVIDENRSRIERGVLDFPVLKNTVLYFFAVSAYDRYKPGTPHNHESKPSREVTARPFAGSEINQ
ncbi:MAG TPA: hypothetical protein PK544_07490 [Spirochaetota bacterium]|nr:hypothetical protein [Spirochaetota bacterium]